MSEKDNGGPAFPIADFDHQVFEPKTVAEAKKLLSGMTLRDYFAAKALPSLISSVRERYDLGAAHQDNNLRFAITAYALADAMLKARAT